MFGKGKLSPPVSGKAAMANAGQIGGGPQRQSYPKGKK